MVIPIDRGTWRISPCFQLPSWSQSSKDCVSPLRQKDSDDKLLSETHQEETGKKGSPETLKQDAGCDFEPRLLNGGRDGKDLVNCMVSGSQTGFRSQN
jgi:hypothetical protein